MTKLFIIPEPLSRAVFVAALALAGFALFRYRQSLNGLQRHLRALLIALRGAAFLLLACVLAGVGIEYEATTKARVLLSYTSAADASVVSTTDALRSGGQPRRRIINALNNRSFVVVEKDEASRAIITSHDDTHDDTYAAGILLTNGAMNAGEAALEVNQVRAATGGAPVFVVVNQTRVDGPMVALESVAVAGPPARGVPVDVRCVVRGRGMRGRESLVTISDEAKVQASASVKWADSDDEWQMLTLAVVPKIAGRINYMVRVEAAGGEDSDALARSFTLYAEERRWRVLFFEGEPTWEAKFIRRALERSRLFEVDYFAQVSRRAAIGATEKAIEQEGGEPGEQGFTAAESRGAEVNSPQAKLRAALASAERLNKYDCIIVGATPNEMLSNAEAARLTAWTERRGGGLVVTGGNSFAGSIAAPNGKLYKLLPASLDPRGFASEAQQLARGVPLEAEKNREAVALLPTGVGAGQALGGYLNAFQRAPFRADVLTGQGLRLGALRPGASMLAVGGRSSNNGPIATSETGAPLIVAARYGAGRTLLFAPSDSWRLHTTTTSAGDEQDETDSPYNALWQGLILWATAGANSPLEIVLSTGAPAAGQKLTIEIRARDALYAPVKIEKLNARLQSLTEDLTEQSNESAQAQPRELAFVPDENDSSVWRASIEVARPGQYAVEADYVAGDRGGSIAKNFAVVAALPTQAGAALDTLSRAAHESGGAFLTSDEVDALAERIAAATINQEKTVRIWELRTWWPPALIIPLLLSAAWLIERLAESEKREAMKA
jgi:hypothetical protein